ncbi:hypothetical protein [Burkholderia sp. WAC0059]|uniref:hypothetical protein n=1 Tax=Burkholderia sp. WAC0059 TaxID=2066022 RepID=UPI0011AF3136|nr:hypothetical protein [Burkholderia sp. WAC0059]
MTKENLPVIHSAQELDIKFPEAKGYIPPKDAAKTQALIQSGCVFTGDGQTFVPTKGLSHLLATDQPGVNKFVNDLPNTDKTRRGEDRFVTTASLQKEVSRRIQEPRDVDKRERLKDTEACLIAFRDHPELDKRRAINELQNRKELPKLKQQILNARGITTCEVSGEPLQPNAAVHHIERQADQPNKSLDPDNLLLVNPGPHGKIHEAEAHSPEALDDLAKQEGWPYKR